MVLSENFCWSGCLTYVYKVRTVDLQRVKTLVMSIDHSESVAALFSALSSENRLTTYRRLRDGDSPKQIAEDLRISRSSLQPYVNDFKELGLIRVEGQTYVFTEKGESVYNLILQVDRMFEDLSELQQFLVENPELVPDQVLDEIRRRRAKD